MVEVYMEEKKKIPFDAIMAAVMIVITWVVLGDGLFVHKLTWAALRYPVVCGGMVTLCAVIEIANAFRKQAASGSEEEGEKKAKPVFTNRRNFLIMVGLMAAYVLLMWLLGFIISSVAIVVAFTLILKAKKPVWVIIGFTVVIVALYYVFRNYLYVFLPRGLLIKMIF